MRVLHNEVIQTFNPARLIRLGRQALLGESDHHPKTVEEQRESAFVTYFKGSEPSEKEAYLYGQHPIIQPRNSSVLSDMLLDGLYNGETQLHNIRHLEPRFLSETGHLTEDSITVVRQITHKRESHYEQVPAELNGWYIGEFNEETHTFGRRVPVLLQPHQVELGADIKP